MLVFVSFASIHFDIVTKKDAGDLLPTDNLAYVFQKVGQLLVEDVVDEDALLELRVIYIFSPRHVIGDSQNQ